MTEKEQQRVSKREFLAQVASRSGIPLRTVNLVYENILDELMEITTRGDQLMLTGFGKFYPQAHKGHRVQFADSAGAIDDYAVLKFSATRSVNKALVQKGAKSAKSNEAGTEALFEEGEPEEGESKPKTRRPRKPKPSTVSLAAAAVQSPRSISRANRLAEL